MSRKHPLRTAAAVAAALTLAAAIGLMAADRKPRMTVKEVMQAVHRAPKGTEPVCKKASDGNASKLEIKQLIECYTELAANPPPQGDEASWKEKTGKLLAAAQALDAGKPDAVAQYKAAVNCKACHSVHKPE